MQKYAIRLLKDKTGRKAKQLADEVEGESSIRR